uniref:Integrator complex subunit 14 beta-barrel domain-containing protein n=1 Tax=Romanomermis culicivorax TaxID=13658 RepID=A0A915IXP6_ROMCU
MEKNLLGAEKTEYGLELGLGGLQEILCRWQADWTKTKLSGIFKAVVIGIRNICASRMDPRLTIIALYCLIIFVDSFFAQNAWTTKLSLRRCCRIFTSHDKFLTLKLNNNKLIFDRRLQDVSLPFEENFFDGFLPGAQYITRMPILIAVDVSLSMHPYLNAKNETDSANVVSLIKNLITRLELYLYRDYIALAYLGEEMSIVVDFTKEYQPLVRIVEKSLSSTSATINFSDCCSQTIQFCQGCYSSLDLSQILIITHSKLAVNSLNLHLNDENSTLSRTLRANNLPISLVLFDNPKHPNMDKTNETIERFLNVNLAGGNLYHAEKVVFTAKYKSSSWRQTLDKLFDENFRPLCATLALGSLKSEIHITPRILNLDLKSDLNTLDESTKVPLQIFGFAKLSDLSNPVTVSRHLITARAIAFRGGEANFPLESMKTPNFCALLHGALKTSDCIALCTIA